MLKADKEKCVGCRVCEIVCSIYHLKEVAPNRGRIKIYPKDEFNMNIEYCRHCKVAKCKEACPNDSFFVNDAGALVVETEKCNTCGLCVKACPFNAIKIDKRASTAIKCDMCDGNYTCVEFCPQKALTVI